MTTTTDTTAAQRREVDALRLAQSMDPATVRRVLADVERTVRRSMGESNHADAARMDATSRALHAIGTGALDDIGAAIGRACRDAIADATRRAATVALVSLDAPVDDSGATLADTIDSGAPVTLGEVSRARLSAMGASTGGYRGVSRVPVPTDCLAAPLPAPAVLSEMARDAVTAEARTILDATVAANTAAEQQRRAEVDALTAYVEQANADAAQARTDSRGARVTVITAERKRAEKARRDARAEVRSNTNPHRPRTSEVAALLGLPVTRGRATVRLAEQQSAAWTAYRTHRAALVSAVLDAWTARLDRDAARARRVERTRRVIVSRTTRGDDANHGRTEAGRRQMAANARRRTHQTRDARRARWARIDRARLTAETWTDSARKVAAPIAPTGRARGACAPYTATNGAPWRDAHRARNGAGWAKGQSISARGVTDVLDPATRTVPADAIGARARHAEPDAWHAPRLPRHGAQAARAAWHACDGVRLPENGAAARTPSREPAAPVTFDAIARACGVEPWTFEPARDWTATAPADALGPFSLTRGACLPGRVRSDAPTT